MRDQPAEHHQCTDAAGTTPELSVQGAVATLSLRRPLVHNRMTPEDLTVLAAQIDHLNQLSAVRIIVLQSEGKSFSSGFDLAQFGRSSSDALSGANPFEDLCDAVENARAITIARLHAPVYGGSTDLALACDFRIGADDIRMFMPAVRLGLHYYGHGLRRWVTRLGLGAAKRLFLTGRTIDATEMLRIGYLDAMVPGQDLDQELQRWIDELCTAAPMPLASMKTVLNATARQAYDEHAAQQLYLSCLSSHDVQEALEAFIHKRKPVFTGT
jgi:enoyl-CoA hydratase